MSSDSDDEEQKCVETGSPICVFYFSHPFAIGPQSGWSRSLNDEKDLNLNNNISPKQQSPAKNNVHSNVNVNVNPQYKTHRHKHNRTANGNLRPIKRYGLGNKCAIVKKRSSWTLVRYLTENIHLHSRRNKLPPLEDVLNTLRAAWIQDNDFSQHQSYSQDNNIEANMATHNHDSRSSSGFPSPVLMRRRLSAPETIMRKHTLSQQRSDSTESDSTQLSSISPARLNKTSSFWNRSSTTGSESNLSRKQYKRDPDLMRKSTLLRRMWSREFTGSISRLYNEEIFPKKTSLSMKSQSRSPVRSIRSSPEHGVGVNKERVTTGSPERLRRMTNDVSPCFRATKWDPDNNMNSYSSTCTSDAATRSRVSSTSESNKSMLETSSTDIKVSSISTSTGKESYTTNTSTRTRTTTTASNSSGGHLDDNSNNSDSAYTNSTQTYSTFSSPKSNPENNNNMDCGTPKQQTLNANFSIGERGQSDNGNTQAPPDLNSNTNKSNANDFKWSNHQTDVDQATPTKIDEHTAELNIVNLSAATLNIIINNSPELNNKVQDLITSQQKQQEPQTQQQEEEVSGESLPDFPQNPEAKLVKVDSVQKPESFYLKRKEDAPITAEHNRLIKYMISNVGAGSPYSKPTEAPQLVVPRYSALPRSISMEVNTSADSTDKESDTASLVDSLDDPNSPRQSSLTPRIKYDDKPVRGDLSALLPDNSSSCKDTPRTKLQKSQAFYVPIVQDEPPETVKTVAEHLPERVRNKLSKRQQVMEQKKQSAKKSDQLDSNGNQPDSLVETEPISEGTWTNNGTLKKVKKEKKLKNPLQSLQSYKVNSRGELMMNPTVTTTKTKRNVKQTKRKPSKLAISESSESSTNIAPPRQSLWNHHAQLKAAANAATSPMVENKVEIIEPPKRAEVKPLYNNRIEILEIMECVEQETENKSMVPNTLNIKNGNRSKIPIPVQKSIESPNRQIQIQSIYQAYDITQVPETSPKTDQLIANILIDALNKSDIDEYKQQEVTKIVYNQLNEKRPPPIAAKIQSNRYQQKFDMIPEEKEKLSSSLGSSDEAKETKNLKTESKEVEVQTQNDCKTPVPNEKKCLADASSQTDLQATELPPRIPNAYKEKAALAMMKDEDFSTIPKGWITFYMLRKSPGSPDSSADEGNNVADGKSNNNIDDKTDSLELRQLRPVLIRKRIGKENLSELHLQEQDFNSNKISNPIRDEDAKKALSLEHINETFTIIKKEHYTSSSESSNTQSPNNEIDNEQKTACPSLPIALPARQGRRQSHRRGRYKTTQSQGTNSTQTPGGWSVTVSGTNSCGQPAPDLEMRLKFPCPQPASQSDSGLGEEHPRQPKRNFENATGENGDFHLPPAKPVSTKKYTVITRKHTSDVPDDTLNSRSFQYLPDLIKNKHQRTKRRDCSVPVTRSSSRGLSQTYPRHPQSGLNPPNLQGHPSLGIVTSMPPLKPRGIPSSGGLKPRQTLTSYRRFSLHHSSHLSPFRTLLPNAISAEALNAADILDLPECFPAILAVTGSQISPENKPKVATMTEKDLTRNHFSYGQHHA